MKKPSILDRLLISIGVGLYIVSGIDGVAKRRVQKKRLHAKLSALMESGQRLFETCKDGECMPPQRTYQDRDDSFLRRSQEWEAEVILALKDGGMMDEVPIFVTPVSSVTFEVNIEAQTGDLNYRAAINLRSRLYRLENIIERLFPHKARELEAITKKAKDTLAKLQSELEKYR